MSSTTPITPAGGNKPSTPSIWDSAGICRCTPPTKFRVMVIADPSRASSDALHWTLTNTILEQDELILLHVETPNSSRLGGALSSLLRRPTLLKSAGSPQRHHQAALSSASSPSSASSSASSSAASAVSAASGNARRYEFLEEMRAACEAVLPKARVRVEKVEIVGREKAATILEQTKRLGVGLLVIGQRRSSSSYLACTRGGSMSGRGLDTAEFLIENCKCRCVSVQKRVYNCGYILNTKTHKNFWHIA